MGNVILKLPAYSVHICLIATSLWNLLLGMLPFVLWWLRRLRLRRLRLLQLFFLFLMFLSCLLCGSLVRALQLPFKFSSVWPQLSQRLLLQHYFSRTIIEALIVERRAWKF